MALGLFLKQAGVLNKIKRFTVSGWILVVQYLNTLHLRKRVIFYIENRHLYTRHHSVRGLDVKCINIINTADILFEQPLS